MKKPQVAIIMGSDSDLPVMIEAARILEDFSIPYHLTIVSAHRTPEKMFSFAKHADSQGFKIIIAGAGGAAHLPGMVASLTTLPVIGVPIKGKSLDGMDSLLSIVQMPPGIPVATVAINGAKNAGILVAKMLGGFDASLQKKVKAYMRDLENTVMVKAESLEKVGYKEYIETKKQ